MAFFAKVANWLANEVVVKVLAESKSFQRFALRTDEARKAGLNTVKETTAAAAKRAAEHSPELKQGFEKGTSFFETFTKTLREEMAKPPPPPPSKAMRAPGRR
ncbi:hypothetical protein M885DRAFT_525346 [Pelagophyceae sp. CCMP2097]|nr:hypothetical protein M885DRAFT_525346 [Pelagophyceae sp. CCMP2097]